MRDFYKMLTFECLKERDRMGIWKMQACLVVFIWAQIISVVMIVLEGLGQ